MLAVHNAALQKQNRARTLIWVQIPSCTHGLIRTFPKFENVTCQLCDQLVSAQKMIDARSYVFRFFMLLAEPLFILRRLVVGAKQQ